MTQNQSPSDTNITHTDSEIDPNILDGYSPFDINVVPVIKPVDGFGSPEGGDGSIHSPTDGGFQDDMYGDEPGAEVTTLEACQELANMVWNLPEMLLGEHLARDESKTNPFAKELYKYCIKKGIDPADYVFDEFGLIVSTAILGKGILADHKAFKRDKLSSSSSGTDDFDSTSGSSEDYTPVEEKKSEYDAASGTNLPDEIESMEE